MKVKGYGLHIGLNRVNPNSYFNHDWPLRCAENNARAMRAFSRSIGLKEQNVTTLLTKDATRERFDSEMARIISKLSKGNLFFLSFSGHGIKVDDFNGDEPSGKDSAWCFYDGHIIDDSIYYYLSCLPKGVRCLIILDCCFSGTAIKGNIKNLLSRATLSKLAPFRESTHQREIKASVKLLAASQEDQTAKGGATYGKFTAALLDTVRRKRHYRSFDIFLNDLCRAFNLNQVPNALDLGPRDKSFEQFVISQFFNK